MKTYLKILVILTILLLVFITLSTKYIGSVDVGSYADPAKYFAGDYSAKIRNSHSYLLGFIHSPFVKLTSSFISFKLSSLIFLALIVISIFYISNKNKKAMFLMLFSPIVWYMAPWINVLQIASLLFLWAYFFISKYHKDKKIKFLLYSGIFLGLSASFWHGVFFFSIPLVIIFMYDKKVSHFFYLIISLVIGMLPLFVLDVFLFSFPFHTIIKSSIGTASNIVSTGIYSTSRVSERSIATILPILLFVPLYFWTTLKPKNFKKNLRQNIFLIISLIIIILNPQVRYFLVIAPLMILSSYNLDKKQFRNQIIFSLILILIIVNIYIIQIKYYTNAQDIVSLIENIKNIEINQTFPDTIIEQDLISISKEFSNQSFIVGNLPDDYAHLARVYWGKDIKELVSIQDYELYLKNESVLFEKEFRSQSRITERREFWISGGIGKPINDNTDYSSIKYAISLDKNFQLENFSLLKEYKILTLWKINN